MTAAFYLAGAVAFAATLAVVLSRNTVHALLFLVVSLFAVAVLFYTVGAPLAAALEVIIYAGAIMVLFVFVIMMLNLGEAAADQERRWLQPRVWIGPAILTAMLLVELLYLLVVHGGAAALGTEVPPRVVGIALFGPYVLAVELASMLLLGALVGALHLGQRKQRQRKQRTAAHDG